MNPDQLYFFSVVFAVTVAIFSGLFAQRQLISHRTGRLIATGVAALTALPLSLAIELPSALAITTGVTLTTYYIFWSAEQAEKQEQLYNGKTGDNFSQERDEASSDKWRIFAWFFRIC